MTIKKRPYVLMLAAFAGATLVPAYAMADDAQSERLQRQIDALQSQLQSLQKQVSETKKAQREASAHATQAPAAAGGFGPAGGPRLPMKSPVALPGGVKMTWGGFLAAEGVYRQHNTVSDMGTPFTSIPYPFSPQYSEPEFRGSARQSRISLLVEGALDPVQKLAGYYEMDFLGAGITSNYNQSNSWAPRLRQGYLIPTAAAFDSFWDSQIREILTRCLLLREEQHRWAERLGSHGLI